MKKYYLFIGVFFCLIFLAGIFILFAEYSKEIDIYKLASTTRESDYKALQNEFALYKEKAKKLRSVVILANNQTSKNLLVGDILTNYASKINGDISIYYKNLTTSESIIIDGDKKYYMASLYKVILTIYILDQIKNGTAKLTDTVGDTTTTLSEVLNKIITESNNEYAQTLAEQYGWNTIETAMKEKLDIDFSFDSDLQTTVTNIGALFEDIALSLKISDKESDYLLKLLNDQTRTSKLPKYLPKHIYSHNKTGEFDSYSHDAGIFYTPKSNYILIFMSKTQYPYQTDEQMALMSKDVYDELNDVVTFSPESPERRVCGGPVLEPCPNGYICQTQTLGGETSGTCVRQ